MELIKSFFRRIVKDMRNKELLPLKLIFFVKTATLFVLYPYLTLHKRQLGINVEETAIMSAISPFLGIIMPPVAGLFADRIGNFKLMLSLFSAFGGAAALLLLLVPVGRSTMLYPESLVLATMGCSPDANFVYGLYQNYPCDSISYAETKLTLRSCGYSCPLNSLNESYVKNILSSRNYKLNVYNVKTKSNSTYDYIISDTDMPEKPQVVHDLRELLQLENVEYYDIAVRQLSTDTLFFPAQRPPLFRLECNAGSNLTVCDFKSGMASPNQLHPTTFETSLKAIKPTGIDETEKRHRYVAEDVQCAWGKNEEIESANVEIKLADETVELEQCSQSCVFTAPRKDVCSNMKKIVEFNPKLTFWTYLGIRVFIGVIGATTFPMFEGAVIAILREQKADYGLQRIYGSIGGMISSPLSGMLIDYLSRDKKYSDLRPAFYLYAGLKISTSFLMMLMNLEFKAPATNVTGDVMKVLKNIEVVALLIACFVLGAAWGYIESFLFWFLEDIGASKSLMGITITVGGIAGIPLLALAGPIIDKIGHANVIFVGFTFYAIRMLGYSLIYDPPMSLIFEALESITSHLTTTAAVTYAAKLSTTSTDSSIQGLLGGLYHGVGRGTGSLTGGYLMKFVGTRTTFQIFSSISMLSGLVYVCFNAFYLSKRPQVEDNVEKKEDDVTDGVKANKERKKSVIVEPINVEDIEAMYNSKNLDIIENFEGEEPTNNDVEMNQRNNGAVNTAFEAEEETGKDKNVVRTLSIYLSLYKRELGIDGKETATIEATTFVIAIIVPPLAGLLADRIGNFKSLLSLLSALGGVGALLLLFVPVGRSTTLYPQNLILTTSSCDSNASVFETYPSSSCDTIPNAKTTLTLESCGYACAVDGLNDNYIQNIVDSRSYKLIGKLYVMDQIYNITNMVEKSKVVYNVSETLQLQNVNEYSTIAARQISKDVYFFSAEDRIHSDIILSTSLKAIDETDESHRYLAEDIECMLADEVMEMASVEVMINDGVLKLDGCYESCVYVAPRRDVCRNMKIIVEYNPKLTFWMYLGIRIFMGILNVTTITMFEGAVIAILRQEKADYGLQKIYEIIAGMMASPLSGMLIDYASRDKKYLDFRPAFYLHAALKVLTGLVMMTINLDFKKPTPNITCVVMKILKNVEMIALLIACLVLGTIVGSIKSFSFWSLEGLRESESLIATSMISGATAGFIFLLMSGQIIKAIGHARFIIVSFILYTVTMFGYSLIYEPGLYPIFEALESATTSLSSVAVVTYAGKLSTWMTDGSIQGLLRSFYHGVGNGSGSLIGSYLMEIVGIRSTYQIFAVVALIMSLGYMWFNLFCLLKESQDKKIDVTEKEYNKSNTEKYW